MRGCDPFVNVSIYSSLDLWCVWCCSVLFVPSRSLLTYLCLFLTRGGNHTCLSSPSRQVTWRRDLTGASVCELLWVMRRQQFGELLLSRQATILNKHNVGLFSKIWQIFKRISKSALLPIWQIFKRICKSTLLHEVSRLKKLAFFFFAECNRAGRKQGGQLMTSDLW